MYAHRINHCPSYHQLTLQCDLLQMLATLCFSLSTPWRPGTSVEGTADHPWPSRVMFRIALLSCTGMCSCTEGIAIAGLHQGRSQKSAWTSVKFWAMISASISSAHSPIIFRCNPEHAQCTWYTMISHILVLISKRWLQEGEKVIHIHIHIPLSSECSSWMPCVEDGQG